uniref:Uncharacterized protein n=1 Tax=uncultured marine virus TaxID=186617 RepID=A0A0F7L786_9VIRU|nr:hypothetical protein [uncultured marine virus]
MLILPLSCNKRLTRWCLEPRPFDGRAVSPLSCGHLLSRSSRETIPPRAVSRSVMLRTDEAVTPRIAAFVRS